MTASKYAELAAGILDLSYKQSAECALKALERPLRGCETWTGLDLVVRAECEAVIEMCPELCIEAVQNRFFGVDGLTAAFGRIYAGVAGGSEGVRSREFVPIDQFVGDVLAHVFLTTILTSVVLVPHSSFARVFEVLTLVLFLGDEVSFLRSSAEIRL